jgi:hypothetical protein
MSINRADFMLGSGYAQYRKKFMLHAMIIHIFHFSNFAAFFLINYFSIASTAQCRIGLSMDLLRVCIRM